MELSRHRNPPRPSCSMCSSSSPWSSTRTTSEPSGRGCRARFICWRERPPGSESPPVAESSCTRIPPSSLCGVPRTNSVSRALASRTHCCAPQRATDRIQLCEFNLAWRERRTRSTVSREMEALCTVSVQCNSRQNNTLQREQGRDASCSKGRSRRTPGTRFCVVSMSQWLRKPRC